MLIIIKCMDVYIAMWYLQPIQSVVMKLSEFSVPRIHKNKHFNHLNTYKNHLNVDEWWHFTQLNASTHMMGFVFCFF